MFRFLPLSIQAPCLNKNNMHHYYLSYKLEYHNFSFKNQLSCSKNNYNLDKGLLELNSKALEQKERR